MTKLLVSVRDAAEAEIALDGGADVIDVKEPARGSLGAPDPEVVQEVLNRIAGRVPISMALGELTSPGRLPSAVAGVAFAKFGLAGCAVSPDWETRWRNAIEKLPPRVTAVAVAYADWQAVDAPAPDRVLKLGAALGCNVFLIDTCAKSRGSLLDHLPLANLGLFIRAAHVEGLQCALAGSLGLVQIGELLPLDPDYVAVRTAACLANRTGPLDPARVRHLHELVGGKIPASHARCRQ